MSATSPAVPEEVKTISSLPILPVVYDPTMVMINLNFLSQVKYEEDIYIDEKNSQENRIFLPGWFSKWVVGYLTQEVKDKNIRFIKENVINGIKYYESLTKGKKSPKQKVGEIQTKLIRCSIGLENLKRNYRFDKLFLCKLDSVIESINNLMNE